ncbi:MAG: oxidoreductase [Rubrivivax sp.]|nr:oxidoreductase [Rubrivivax sp.]
MFKALVIDKEGAGASGITAATTRATIRDVDDSALPMGDVTVRIAYSTVNYKDGLAITGKTPVVRQFPLHAGIDFAGTVEASSDDRFKPGDAVLLNGYGVGESHSGGLAQKARVKADWLLPIPAGLTPRRAMAIGTAGYTAMLCVMALGRHGLVPGSGDVLVTGANGGVGTIAITLLAAAGHRVVASTGRLHEAEFLKQLGAAEVIPREQLSQPGKPLAKERWAAVIDSVGSHTLVNACAGTRYGGVVAACGLAQGMDFPGSVAPFILRGITLVGIDSVMAPMALRREAWARLAAELDLAKLEALTQEIPLAAALQAGSDILAGRVRGRLVVNVNA